jgi:hypothetical protein
MHFGCEWACVQEAFCVSFVWRIFLFGVCGEKQSQTAVFCSINNSFTNAQRIEYRNLLIEEPIERKTQQITFVF